ncbi:hypothetical protein CJF32_00007249 [Rutstroemia sp. NJR-2017a WRK4]|nr:hypothetical protein CJF32_00007249 [Rutstroemia sp. NJR-2017a WRK4]
MNRANESQGERAVTEAISNDEQSLPRYQDPTTYPFPESTVPPFVYSIFPKDIFIYREDYISLILGPPYKANESHPLTLFYVSVHMDNRWTNNSSVPQIRLHFGPDNTYPVIGTASFRFNATSDITIWHDPTSTSNETSTYDARANASSETNIELSKKSIAMKDVHVFQHMIMSTGGTLAREKFEWRHSGDPEVKAFATENIPGENITQENRGLKLVRVSTGQMLALYCGGKHSKVQNPQRVAGKLRFIGPNVLDPLVVVMTILTIIERSRRNATYNAAGLAGCVLS